MPCLFLIIVIIVIVRACISDLEWGAPLIDAPRDLPNRNFLAEPDHLPPSFTTSIDLDGLEGEVIYFHNAGAPFDPCQGDF